MIAWAKDQKKKHEVAALKSTSIKLSQADLLQNASTQTWTGSRQLYPSWKGHVLSSTSHIWLNQKYQLLEAPLPRPWNHDDCLSSTGKWVHINLPHPAHWGLENNLFRSTSYCYVQVCTLFHCPDSCCCALIRKTKELYQYKVGQ